MGRPSADARGRRRHGDHDGGARRGGDVGPPRGRNCVGAVRTEWTHAFGTDGLPTRTTGTGVAGAGPDHGDEKGKFIILPGTLTRTTTDGHASS